MTNKYLSYDAERGPKVRAMFSRLAWRYDLINDLMSLGMHRRWKRETVDLALAGSPRARVLDLFCGTGALAIEAQRPAQGRPYAVRQEHHHAQQAEAVEHLLHARHVDAR